MTVGLELGKPSCVLLLIQVSFFSLVPAAKNAYGSLDASRVGRVMAQQMLPKQLKRVSVYHSYTSSEDCVGSSNTINAVTCLCPGLQCPRRSSDPETGRKGA